MANKLRNIIILLIFTQSVHGQISFFKTYGGNGYDYGQGVVQLPDSSYAVTGASSSFYEGPSQAFILLADSLGNHIWSRSYGGENSDWGRRIFHKENEGFWIAGYSNSFSDDADFDFYLVKTDENGEPEWERTYGTSDWEKLWDAILLPDDGLILVGETNGLSSQDEDIYIVRTAANGDEVWSQHISNPGKDIAYSCKALSDTTFVIGGTTLDEVGVSKGFLSLYHIDGTEIWSETYGSLGQTVIRDFAIYDNRIYAVGHKIRENEEDLKKWIVKVFFDGTVDNEVTETLEGDISISNIAILADEKLYFTAWATSPALNPFEGGTDVFLYRYQIWLSWNGLSGSFSGVGPDECHQMIISLDGSPVMVGLASDPLFTSGGNNITLIKLGPDESFPPSPAPYELVNLWSPTETKSEISIYPNPVKENLNVSLKGSHFSNGHSFDYSIYEMSGKKVSNGNSTSVVPTAYLQSGIYILEILLQNEVHQFRFVKE